MCYDELDFDSSTEWQTLLLHLMARVHAMQYVNHQAPCCMCQSAYHTTIKLWHNISCSSLPCPSVNFYIATTEEFEQELTLLSSRFESTHNSCWYSQTPLHSLYHQSKWKWRNSPIVMNPELNLFYNQSLLMFYSVLILTIKLWNLQSWKVPSPPSMMATCNFVV